MIEEIINNINYRLDNDNLTAEVTEKSGGYEGAIVIPETLVFNDVTYRVTTIGEWAFCDCSSLTSIAVAEGNPTYDSRDNCNGIIHSSSDVLIAGCQSTVIPNTVIEIGEEAFRGNEGGEVFLLFFCFFTCFFVKLRLY